MEAKTRKMTTREMSREKAPTQMEQEAHETKETKETTKQTTEPTI